MDRALLRGPSYGDELKAWSVRLAPLGPTPRLGTVSRIYATMLFVRTTTNREVTMRLIADDYEGPNPDDDDRREGFEIDDSHALTVLYYTSRGVTFAPADLEV